MTIELSRDIEAEFFRNRAKNIPVEDLKLIGQELKDAVQRDEDSLTELKGIRTEYGIQFDLKFEEKNKPWTSSANIKIPVITASVANFQSRSSLNLFSGRDIVQAFPLTNTPDAQSRAARIAKHLNYQIRFKIPNYLSNFNKSLMSLGKDGYAFRKVFWDSISKSIRAEPILPQDFIVDYNTQDLETSYRYTHVLHLTENEIKIKGRQGLYINTDEIQTHGELEDDIETTQNKRNVGQNETEPDYTTPRKVLEVHTWIELPGDKVRRPYIVTIDKETGTVFRIINRFHPETNQPINYIIAYTFMPNPNTIFGHGFGPLLLGANKMMNTNINQLADAGTLSNMSGKTGWILKGSGMTRGDVSFELGQFKQVSLRTNNINDAIKQIQVQPPSGVLLNLVTFLQGYVDRLTTVTEIFSGAQPRSDTTATGQQLAVEQGAKFFTSIQQSVHREASREYQTIAQLNSIFLDEQEYRFVVQDNINSIEEAIISRLDYKEPMSVIPVSDPNIISQQQQLFEAQALREEINSNPFLAQDPSALRIAMNEKLKALRVDSTTTQALNAIMEESVRTAQNQRIVLEEQARQIQEQKAAEQAQQQAQQADPILLEAQEEEAINVLTS